MVSLGWNQEEGISLWWEKNVSLTNHWQTDYQLCKQKLFFSSCILQPYESVKAVMQGQVKPSGNFILIQF
jgi:hypothetical protein